MKKCLSNFFQGSQCNVLNLSITSVYQTRSSIENKRTSAEMRSEIEFRN